MARDSFAIPPTDPVAAAGGEMVPVRAGTSGGGQGYGLSTAPGFSVEGAGSTIQSLMKLGEKVLGPKVKQEQERLFAQGLYRVAAGAAVADIEKDEKSWTDIYGPSLVVEGARVGSAQARSAALAAEAEGNMDSMSMMGPAEMQAWYTDKVKSMATGDDDIFVGMAMKEAPGVFKLHAKMHAKFQQEQANTADRTFMGVQISRHEAMLRTRATDAATGSPPRYGDEDVERSAWEVMDALLPKPGQNPNTKQQNVVDAVTAMASTGNFLTIAALENGLVKDADGNPIKPLAGLDPKIRDNLERTLQTEGSRWNWRSATPKTLGAIMDFYRTSYMLSAEDASKRINQINADHSAETGIKVPLLSNHEAITQTLQNGRAMAAEAARVSKEQAKVAANEQAINMGVAALDQPNGWNIVEAGIRSGNITRAQADAAQQRAWENAPPEQKLKLLQNNPQVKLKPADDFFSGSFNATREAPNQGTMEAFAYLSKMNKAARELYLDRNALALFDAFELALTPLGTDKPVDPNTAWTRAVAGARYAAEQSPESRKAVTKLVEQAVKANIDPGWFSPGEDVQGYGYKAVLAQAEKAARYYPYTKDGLKALVENSLNNSPDYTRMGPHVVLNQGRGQRPLFEVFNPEPDAAGKRTINYQPGEIDVAFHLLVKDKLKHFKVDADDVTIVRQPDDQGQPRFMVDWGGQPIYIKGGEITRAIDDKRVAEWQKAARARQLSGGAYTDETGQLHAPYYAP